jgi:hypothetical protein
LSEGIALRHGHTVAAEQSPAYVSWAAMKRRCYNETDRSYAQYGGRGIVVCERWRDSFESFYVDMGERPPRTSLDRINNDGNYEPANCRWATASVQSKNRREQRRGERGRFASSVPPPEHG